MEVSHQGCLDMGDCCSEFRDYCGGKSPGCLDMGAAVPTSEITVEVSHQGCLDMGNSCYFFRDTGTD